MIEITREQDQQAELFAEAVMHAAGLALQQVVRHLIEGGEDPTAAVRHCGASLLLSQFGDRALMDLGVPQRTSNDIRARLRSAMRAAGEVQPPEGYAGPPSGRRAASTAEDARAS